MREATCEFTRVLYFVTDQQTKSFVFCIDPATFSPRSIFVLVSLFTAARNLRREDLTGTQCGTPLYQAPEQHENSLYGEKIDLWSVGAILYEMVTGRKVFDVQTMKELHTASQSDPHIILSPTVDKNPHCRAILMGLLKKVPAERMTYDEFFIHPFLRPDLPSSPLIQTQGGRGRG